MKSSVVVPIGLALLAVLLSVSPTQALPSTPPPEGGSDSSGSTGSFYGNQSGNQSSSSENSYGSVPGSYGSAQGSYGERTVSVPIPPTIILISVVLLAAIGWAVWHGRPRYPQA